MCKPRHYRAAPLVRKILIVQSKPVKISGLGGKWRAQTYQEITMSWHANTSVMWLTAWTHSGACVRRGGNPTPIITVVLGLAFCVSALQKLKCLKCHTRMWRRRQANCSSVKKMSRFTKAGWHHICYYTFSGCSKAVIHIRFQKTELPTWRVWVWVQVHNVIEARIVGSSYSPLSGCCATRRVRLPKELSEQLWAHFFIHTKCQHWFGSL